MKKSSTAPTDGDEAVAHEVHTPRGFGPVRFERYAGAQWGKASALLKA